MAYFFQDPTPIGFVPDSWARNMGELTMIFNGYRDYSWLILVNGELLVTDGRFGTCFFHSAGNFIIPTDFHIFQRGRYTTNQYINSYDPRDNPPSIIQKIFG